MKDFKIKTIWTNEITTAEIEDFRNVVNTVFGDFCTEEYFRVKYLENIYGPSLLIIVYMDGKPIGANSLWRNDICGREAYYSAETSVIQSANSIGVFASMIMTMSKLISKRKGIPLYTFPNSNSFPGFQKSKWNIRWKRKVLFVPGISSNNQLQHIDRDYALWWLIQRKAVCYIKRFGHYYLIKAFGRRGCVLGMVDKDTALHFPKLGNKYIFLFCYSDKETFYNRNKRPIPIVYCNVTDLYIPYWKRDAI